MNTTFPRPAYDRIRELFRNLNEDASLLRVRGLAQVVMIAEANVIDEAAERHRAENRD